MLFLLVKWMNAGANNEYKIKCGTVNNNKTTKKKNKYSGKWKNTTVIY